MKGRHLQVWAGLLFASILHPAVAKTEGDAWPYNDPTPAGPIGYINPNIEPIPVPKIAGQTYEDLVPDTFDVQSVAERAINVLTCATDANQDHEQYISAYIGNPLRMAHNFGDWCTPKYMEALPLLRMASGSIQFAHVDQVWSDMIMKSLGPDGLFYLPLEGKPWYGKELWWSEGIVRADGTIFDTKATRTEIKKEELDTFAQPHAHSMIQESGINQFTHPQPCGRILNTMMIYYLRDQNPYWKEAMRKMIDRLYALTVKKDDYCYFPAFYYEPNAEYDPQDPRAKPPTGLVGGELNGRSIMGPAMYYQLTGYEPARKLAEGLTRFMLHHADYFGPNGEFTADRHFHAHTFYMLEMLTYAEAVKDQETIAYLAKAYEWARTPEAGMSVLTGFTPEFAKPYRTSEGCAVGDMLQLATRLSAAGAGDYYPDAERWARNFFSEIQMSPAKSRDLVRWGETMPPKKLLYNETDQQVGERSVGGYASWATANEWLGGDERDSDNLIMHCCTGNCARAIYYLWREILTVAPGRLQVNMLLNRAAKEADIYSHIPFQGRVDIKLKQDFQSVRVHAPEWIASGSAEIKATRGREPLVPKWDGRYLELGPGTAGQTFTLTFPISERTVKERIGLDDYSLTIKGDTVVAIDPPGKHCPLFQRGHFRENQTSWHKVNRFVADRPIKY